MSAQQYTVPHSAHMTAVAIPVHNLKCAWNNIVGGRLITAECRLSGEIEAGGPGITSVDE